jgi:hypothetical protein
MVLRAGEDVREVSLDQLPKVGHRPQAAVRGAPDPAGEESPGPAGVEMGPDLTDVRLATLRLPHLQVTALEGPDAADARFFFDRGSPPPLTPEGQDARSPYCLSLRQV